MVIIVEMVRVTKKIAVLDLRLLDALISAYFEDSYELANANHAALEAIRRVLVSMSPENRESGGAVYLEENGDILVDILSVDEN